MYKAFPRYLVKFQKVSFVEEIISLPTFHLCIDARAGAFE